MIDIEAAEAGVDPSMLDTGPIGRVDRTVKRTKHQTGPLGKRRVEYLKAMEKAVTPQQIAQITDSLVEKAMDGNLAAAKIVFEYLIGKPKTVSDVEEEDQMRVTMELFGNRQMRKNV